MKKLLLPCLGLLLAHSVRAAVLYWNPEGTATPTGANLTGTWDGSAEWSSISAQTNVPVVWSSGVAACFSAGSVTVATPFTVTLNSAMTIGGIFNGSLNPPGFFVTISGTGSLTLAPGADAFSTGGTDNGTTTIAVPMTGSGQVALESASQIYLNATNTYTGGTIFGFPGVASWSGIVNFNNSKSFGTGPIQMSSVGTGAMVMEGALPFTITNAFIATNSTMNIVGNAAGLTLSGPWNLGATPVIGSGGSGNLITISGPMSGAGGFTKYNPSTLVLSGTNTYTGGTTVSGGVLSVTADNNLGTAPATATVNLTLSGGTLNASNTFTISSNRLTSLTTNSSISVASGKTLTYAGAISGGAGLTKSGTGTLALGGANGYSGGTTISAGTLEADSHGGSAVGTNTVLLQSAGTLTGSGIVSGLVSGNGKIAPGTPSGPATLTLGNGMDLSTGGTFTWNLSSNSTSGNYSAISLIGGNLTLGGSSKVSVNFSGTASAPSTNNTFWQTQEAWTIIPVSGSAGNSNATKFASIVSGAYAAGNFTNFIYGNGSIVLLYQPNFAVFDALYDSGPGFFSGENLILTNFSGLSLSTWSSTNASLSVSNWTLEGVMQEQSLAPGLPGYSRYSINVSPTVSPTYYVAGNMNTGPYIYSPVPATTLTTPDFSTFNVVTTNVAIRTNGLLALLPAAPPVILTGSTYSNGGFQLHFTAGTNQTYTIQASTNFTTWTNVSSGTVTNSPVIYIDPAATNFSDRFYRISLP